MAKFKIEITYKPGVLDSEGNATLGALKTLGFRVSDVKSAKVYTIETSEDAKKLKRCARNSLQTQSSKIILLRNSDGFVKEIYKKADTHFEMFVVNLSDASDKELIQISNDRGLALTLQEMKLIKNIFPSMGETQQTSNLKQSRRLGASTPPTKHSAENS